MYRTVGAGEVPRSCTRSGDRGRNLNGYVSVDRDFGSGALVGTCRPARHHCHDNRLRAGVQHQRLRLEAAGIGSAIGRNSPVNPYGSESTMVQAAAIGRWGRFLPMSESITRLWASAAPDGSSVTVPERDGEAVVVDASSLLEPQAESHASCSVCIASFGVRSSLKRPQCFSGSSGSVEPFQGSSKASKTKVRICSADVHARRSS